MDEIIGKFRNPNSEECVNNRNGNDDSRLSFFIKGLYKAKFTDFAISSNGLCIENTSNEGEFLCSNVEGFFMIQLH